MHKNKINSLAGFILLFCLQLRSSHKAIAQQNALSFVCVVVCKGTARRDLRSDVQKAHEGSCAWCLSLSQQALSYCKINYTERIRDLGAELSVENHRRRFRKSGILSEFRLLNWPWL